MCRYRKKLKVKCVAIGKRKFKSSKNQMEDLHKSLDRKKTDKNAKKEMRTPKVED